ncbi:MAG: heme exporter protein CcmD [Pseudomonadota bacterium]
MMVDLGVHAEPVLLAYAATLALIGGLVWATLRRHRSVKADLEKLETGRKHG